VFILLDAVRADRIGLGGGARVTMPFVEQLGARGLLFERAYAPSSWTPSSMASIFTGLWVHQHGVLSGFAATRSALKRGERVRLNRIPETIETLPEVLKRAGYRTFGAADNMNMGPAMGLSRGFDEFSPKEAGGLRHGKTLAEWRDALASGSGPYFLYLHYMAAHAPYRRRAPWYDPNTPARRREVAAYDSNLSFLDQEIRELFELLGLERGALVVITADHGEEFEEHGGVGHRHTLYEELVRVPLVLYAPGRVAPGRVRTPVSTIDILPTLRELLGLPASPADQGTSLLRTARSGGDASRLVFPMRWDELGPQTSIKQAVVGERYKLILTLPEDSEELYDLSQDPGETRNLAREKRPLAQALRRELESLLARYRPAAREFGPELEISKEKAEELRALGYVR
jgi:arylsulfatase A-like enzyme